MVAYIGMMAIFLWSMVYYFLREFITIIQSFFSTINQDIVKLQEEIVKLKRERDQISMMNEFAKYAKLDRKIMKTMDEIKKIRSHQSQENLKYKMFVTGVAYFLYYVVALIIVYVYYSEPLLVMPTAWFFPVNSLINIPTGVSGGVGVLFWFMCCNMISKKMHQYFKVDAKSS